MYNGRANATAVMDTIVTLDPNVDQAAVLRARQVQHEKQCLWITENGREDSSSTEALRPTGNIQACEVEEKFTAKEVVEACSTIKGGALVYGKVSGYVANVLFCKNMTFSVCGSCKRYVPRALGRCGRCQGATALLPVARVTLALMDDTGTLVLTLYGRVAESFLGMPVCCRQDLWFVRVSTLVLGWWATGAVSERGGRGPEDAGAAPGPVAALLRVSAPDCGLPCSCHGVCAGHWMLRMRVNGGCCCFCFPLQIDGRSSSPITDSRQAQMRPLFLFSF